jgi:alpha-galactosidase
MDFYREAAPVIKRGRSRIFGPPQISYRHPKGWQAVVRRGEGDRILLVVHVFSGKTPEEIRISLEDPSGGGCRKYSVGRVYAHDEGDVRIDGSTAIIRPNGGMYALGALFEEEGGEMNG